MPDPANSPTRQRILEAVIDCIEREGVTNLTTRKIAEQAGTNLASINYYFRSKELLIAEALSMTLDHMLGDVVEITEVPGRTYLETLEEVLVYLIGGGLQFPGVIRAHLSGVIFENRYDQPVVKVFQKLYTLLSEKAIQAYPETPAATLNLSISQILSSTLFTLIAPGLFQPMPPLDLSQRRTPRQLANYLAGLFERSLALRVGPEANTQGK